MKKFWLKNPKAKGSRSGRGREQSLRFFQRTPANGLVRIKSSKRDYSGYLVNVSQEGLMSKSRELPDANEKITVSFRLSPKKDVYQMKAVVVWTAPMKKPDYFKKIGVRFIDPGAKERKHLGEYVNRFSSVGS